MPKRYRITRGSPTWTWVYEDKATKAVFAKSNERWETKREVKDAIEEMKRAPIEEDEDGS